MSDAAQDDPLALRAVLDLALDPRHPGCRTALARLASRLCITSIQSGGPNPGALEVVAVDARLLAQVGAAYADPDPRLRLLALDLTAVLRLAAFHREVIAQALAANADWSVARAALTALGRIGTAADVPLLARAVTQGRVLSHDEAQDTVLDALAAIGDASAWAAFEAQLRDPRPDAAAQTIAREEAASFPEALARPRVIARVQDTQWVSAEALARWGHVEDLALVLPRFAAGDTRLASDGVLDAIGRLTTAATLPAVRAAERAADAALHRSSIQSLESGFCLGRGLSGSSDQGVWDALEDIVRGAHDPIALAAASAAYAAGHRPESQAVLERAFQSHCSSPLDEAVIAAAAGAVADAPEADLAAAAYADLRVPSALRALIVSRGSSDAMQTALAAVGSALRADAVEGRLYWSSTPRLTAREAMQLADATALDARADSVVRGRALIAGGGTPAEAAQLALDPDPYVRACALFCMARLDMDMPTSGEFARAALLRALARDPRGSVRQSAAQSLGYLAFATLDPGVGRALARAVSDDADALVRVQAARSLIFYLCNIEPAHAAVRAEIQAALAKARAAHAATTHAATLAATDAALDAAIDDTLAGRPPRPTHLGDPYESFFSVGGAHYLSNSTSGCMMELVLPAPRAEDVRVQVDRSHG